MKFLKSDIINRKFIDSIDINDLEIETDTGWHQITHIHKTVPYYKWHIETEFGLTLDCADTHILFDEHMNEIFCKDLTPGISKICTKNGIELIKNIVESKTLENMYDLTVDSNDHRFYTNDILSHNSLILDAICFGLFGKAFRNINKPLLVNSINKKHCRVTVEFKSNGRSYRIIRGIKPAIFEIFQDGTLLNQDAASKDYQKILEQQILKLNFKSFCQIVILGSASFTPFMQLAAAQRREVIEDILDIRVFSVMSQIRKERAQENRDSIAEIDKSLQLARTRVDSQRKLIETIDTSRESTINRIRNQIQELFNSIEEEIPKQELIKKKIEVLSESIVEEQSLKTESNRLNSTKNTLKFRLESVTKHRAFIDETSDCPSCKQKISDDHRKRTVIESELEARSIGEQILEIEKSREILKNKLDLVDDIKREITRETIALSSVTNTIGVLNKQVSRLNAEIESYRNDRTNVEAEKQRLKTLASDAMGQIEKKNSLLEEKKLHDIAGILLKDTGIKTSIIREYLPILNDLINYYLGLMEFYIEFQFDENFGESIRARHKEDFSYSSFSEGEKSRINLAILFAFRQIAKRKNSINTNLLIFDEILDSSLDEGGMESFLSVLEQLENINIVIITHRTDSILDRFDRVITVSRINNFTSLS